MGKFSDKAIEILNYVREHEEEGITAKDIAKGIGKEDQIKSVNATLTAAFTNHKEETGEEVDGKKVKVVKPLMVRVPGELEIEDENGKISHEKVKFVKMTDYGKTYDYNA